MLLFYYALDCIGLKDLAKASKGILKIVHHIDVDLQVTPKAKSTDDEKDIIIVE